MISHRRFLALICVLGIVSAAFAQEQEDRDWYLGKPIRDIIFTGLNNVNSSDLDGLMRPYRGLPFTDNTFWEIQRTLYETELFDRIDPSARPADPARSEVVIQFAVVERPVIGRINFMGNKGLRRTELMSTISIKVNDVVNQGKIHVDEQAIINKYLEKGYTGVKIRSETDNINPQSVAVTFYIDEGKKLAVKDLLFEGNSVFSDRTLRGRLSLKTKTGLREGAFQEAKLLADQVAIKSYYHERGYIEAEVIDVIREETQDAKGNNLLILTFRIFEGRKYNLTSITFSGNQIFSDAQIEKLIRSRMNDTINARQVEADIQRIQDLYFENGYIFNTFDRTENKDQATGDVSYHIAIREYGRAHIENIIIVGNKKTKTEVILREIPLEPGDVFSKTKVQEAMRNLYNLQYFSAIYPDTTRGSTDSLMNLIFTVEEQPTIDLQMGVTFSGSADPDTFPVSVLLKWNDRNIKGTGNQLGVDATAAPDTINVVFNYTERWIFGLPLSGGFDFTVQWAERFAAQRNSSPFFNGDEDYAYPEGFSSYREYVDANRVPPDEFLMTYDQWYLSLGFSTGYRWITPLGIYMLGGGIRTGFIFNYYEAELYTPFDPALRAQNNQWTPKNSFWLTTSLDQRDIFYDPSRGYYIMNRIGFYGLVPKDAEIPEREYYIRNDTKAEYFISLLNIPVTETWNFRTVLGFHTGLSFIFIQPGRETDKGLPAVERANMLAVDGMFVGRGWNTAYTNKGFALWENWVELRFPIVQGILAWDFFFDAATVEGREKDWGYYFQNYDWDESMLYSFGGGIRITIPQFPIRLSLAKRFKTRDGEIEWQYGPIGGERKEGTATQGTGLDFVFSFALSSY